MCADHITYVSGVATARLYPIAITSACVWRLCWNSRRQCTKRKHCAQSQAIWKWVATCMCAPCLLVASVQRGCDNVWSAIPSHTTPDERSSICRTHVDVTCNMYHRALILGDSQAGIHDVHQITNIQAGQHAAHTHRDRLCNNLHCSVQFVRTYTHTRMQRVAHRRCLIELVGYFRVCDTTH